MKIENLALDAKLANEKALYIAQQKHAEMLDKVRTAIESAIYTFYGFQKGTIVNTNTDTERNYAIQSFDISTPNILLNNNMQDIIDRVRVILCEVDDLGELNADKINHTVTCFIADLTLKK